MLDKGLLMGKDGKIRCSWAGTDPLYCAYHDDIWGKPVFDDRLLFAQICLEGFQAGLAWLTILRKISNFYDAFDGFDFEKIAQYDEKKIEILMQDKGIIRHRGKIRSVVNNALKAQEIIAEWNSLSHYFWSFQTLQSEQYEKTDCQTWKTNSVTPASIRLSKDLKKRGWTFVGPITCYAFMQAVGIVNDHLEGCFCR
ncbi:DNA-3-methyladenine glycosylase I [Bartonella sp. CDC_skunk]|uniref:DNA-3-methyladenine glycosylase I n=1 Tax=Bartonella rochalimae ATCC BAA-1498 TaxID=685782 RepID=E6YKI3_9HYPH|nr:MULTISPECIES: DNA-3-methyladenine glycosylase I [unclassified Bartonella]AQX21778.1 DNA-3-methyladenine glycosylase I [Bartonella sp. CDC_skunk]AQX27043.1 DNA-3-methyladenine glycosylase I [Bartonella sp. Raccoon60]KEC54096.1 DNA-3-methyladenine glycosylase I [Bartonella rochalimae ATCC BAA-1498]CBI77371.1 DNA-3-methyladenine glycosylase I [Bartonella rochalimae ATCC BAA-1498]